MNRLLIEVILILGISVAANLGYAWWKDKQQDIGYEKCRNEVIVDVAKKNETIVSNKKKVKHENQNRNRDALVRLHCKRGWVLDPDQCVGISGQGGSNLRGHREGLDNHAPSNSDQQRNVVGVKKATPIQRRTYNE